MRFSSGIVVVQTLHCVECGVAVQAAAHHVASDHGPRTADAAPAVHVHHLAGGDRGVDIVEDCAHLDRGWAAHVEDGSPHVYDVDAASLRRRAQQLVVPIQPVVFRGQVDEVPDAGVEQRAEPLLRRARDRRGRVLAGEELVVNDPVAVSEWDVVRNGSTATGTVKLNARSSTLLR